MKIKYIVPPLYQSYFPSSIWNADIQETKATCHQCIQAPHKYDSVLKCCTFWPFIPNYIVGQILLSTDEKYQKVKSVVQDHIARRLYSLPMGLMAPPDYQVNFKRKKKSIFGRNEDFLCPYFSKETNNCGAWLYRGSVCTSFFCESSFAGKGQAFWQQFENYLSYLEMGLSQEVLTYKDYSPRDVNVQLEFLNVKKVKRLVLPTYKKIWKHFYGNEAEFYVQAAQFVDQMPKSQVDEVIGETGVSIRNLLSEQIVKLK